MTDDDLLVYADEGNAEATPSAIVLDPWRVLIVDDDEEVHRATRFALKGLVLFGRAIEFESAYSGVLAREVLRQRSFCCILLDVVMESEDAGLRLVGFIRDELGDQTVRIVLRTGQPGFAPELEVIRQYDINDYKSKSELTSTRLTATLTAALRSWSQIRAIEANRRGLEMIIEAASSLMAVKAVDRFARGVLMQICSLLEVSEDGVLCALLTPGASNQPHILAASGRYADLRGQPLESIGDASIQQRIADAYQQRKSMFTETATALFIHSARGEELVVHVATPRPLSELDRKLLEIFSINIAVGFDSARLFEQLEHLAFYDRLTGLSNRAAFERELERRSEAGEQGFVVLADIDNFQAVNDGLGHEVGDATLCTSAQILNEVFGTAAFIARTSADSFSILMTESSRLPIEDALRRLSKRLENNIEVEGNEVPLSMSLGVAPFPDHSSDVAAPFRNAGIALKQAKRVSRSSFQFFDNDFERDLQRRLQTIRELRYSVERKCLRLLYQPQVRLKTGRVFGVEALVRWQRTPTELVSPLLFIPAAEDSGHIVTMGEWILREACRQQLEWKLRTGQSLNMAVNVSMRQLKDVDFGIMLKGVLAETSIDPSLLELEVTESLMMENSIGLVGVLEKVRSLGIRVAIDDFGTGYSSLSHLQRLPIDRLKIDRAFITGLTQRAEDQVIAALVINMGHLLKLEVIAEGVETAEQRDRLLAMGCDDGQGYLFGKPMTAQELIAKVSAEAG